MTNVLFKKPLHEYSTLEIAVRLFCIAAAAVFMLIILFALLGAWALLILPAGLVFVLAYVVANELRDNSKRKAERAAMELNRRGGGRIV